MVAMEPQNSSTNSFNEKLEKIKTDFSHIAEITQKLAKDDPRRVVHSLKVGLAITLVSLFYYFDPLYQGFGVNAMWAVLTVVVVFEFSVGATLGKGVNRVLATIIGGLLAVGAHRLSLLAGPKLEPFLMASSVFITATVSTFVRFFPKIKARFDYGVLIFILSFSLICVSGYREDEVIDMAHRRVTTILIGSSTAVITCLLIWPVWAGTDLHNLTANNIDKLGHFLQEFGGEYFKNPADITSKDSSKAHSGGFKNILDSKNSVDSLFNFAKWEPRHGRFKQGHPWLQYQNICELTRHCACKVEALYNVLHSHPQAPKEVKAKFQEPCSKISIETGKALKELSSSIRKMTQPTKVKSHIQNAKQATQNLNIILHSKDLWKTFNLSDVTQVGTITSTLAQVVTCTEEIAKAVEELASLAKFKAIVDAKVVPENERIKKLNNQTSIKHRRSFNSHVIIVDSSSQCTQRLVDGEDPPSLSMAQQNAE
ncbi:aluminum-activated malate transporter 2-like [Silene latifolia]|uniref:aluminum-activated malate transporter 2-like n=1 Tax=Silene latifolia TaxID=37657 RepID=UPI003D774D14